MAPIEPQGAEQVSVASSRDDVLIGRRIGAGLLPVLEICLFLYVSPAIAFCLLPLVLGGMVALVHIPALTEPIIQWVRWGKNGVQDRAFHARHELDDSRITDVLNKAVDDVVTELAVGHLAAAEAEAGFHLVAIGEEADGLILLGLVVVLVHGHGELDFLDGDNFLLLSGGTLALFLLVEIAAIVLNAADGRDGSGRNFDQVKAAFAGNLDPKSVV